MACSKRTVSLAIFLLTLLFSTATFVRAQNAPPPPPQGSSSAQQSEDQDEEDQQAPQTPEERARVLRDAQARVQARRQQRVAQTIKDTYSHRYEVYFGGGYLRNQPGDTLQKDTEGAWNVGLTRYLSSNLGVAADFRGYYGTAFLGVVPLASHPSISKYTFLFGPQYRVFSRPRWAAGLQGLVGAAHGNFTTNTGNPPLPPEQLGVYPNGTVFSASAVAPVDFNLSPGLALRVAPQVLFTNFGGSFQTNFGWNANVVYRWGRQ